MSNFFEKAGEFASDAAIDTAADAEINRVVDGVAEHVPFGSQVDAMAKTGIDLAANNAINAELTRVEGMFGHKDAPAPQPDDDAGSADDNS
ncbi:MAG TPA: hypothetical protein VGN14_00475 [Candidatus Elarobacter sp.]|jgi:hypothetical protein